MAMRSSNPAFFRPISSQGHQGRFFTETLQNLLNSLSSANDQISSATAIQVTSQILQTNLAAFLTDLTDQSQRDEFIAALLTCPQDAIANFCSEQQSGTTSTASSTSTEATTTTTTTQSTTTGKVNKT